MLLSCARLLVYFNNKQEMVTKVENREKQTNNNGCHFKVENTLFYYLFFLQSRKQRETNKQEMITKRETRTRK